MEVHELDGAVVPLLHAPMTGLTNEPDIPEVSPLPAVEVIPFRPGKNRAVLADHVDSPAAWASVMELFLKSPAEAGLCVSGKAVVRDRIPPLARLSFPVRRDRH